jgi:hypothetical protein
MPVAITDQTYLRGDGHRQAIRSAHRQIDEDPFTTLQRNRH